MANEMKKTDAQIHHDVLEELKWDARVKETDVGVEGAVRGTHGVRKVENQVLIRA